jgi:class 3 adenylate cyclase/tetratricopeptide (TPR) repeat protein
MECPKCRAENLADSSFCSECGAKIELSCPACGAGNLLGAKFCRKCGERIGAPERAPATRASFEPRSYTPKHLVEKILTSRSALEGERKQVTILFADVKGSTERASDLDPEEWHGIMDRFFQILAEGVHRFEGTVNEYRGDGIMALFGAPIAHEDHAQRACYAALHLRESLRHYADELRIAKGISFAVRMGLNSGEVVVGKIGDDLRMDYTALGHAANLAARMEQIAAADSTYLSEHTAKLVSGYFQLRDLGETRIKGLSDSLHVFELEGVGRVRTRLDVSRSRGFSRFVGRQDETAALEAALSRAIAGSAQVVGIVGEPGVGKSRLCFEFLERCRARGLAVFEAHGVPHGKTLPLLPMLELLRSFFGITEQDSPQAAREKIAGRYVLLDESLREVLPLVFDLLGVADPERPSPAMDPETRHGQLAGVVKRVTQMWGRRQAAVTFLEDLHWFDGGSEGFLEAIVEALPGTQWLVLLNFRPEYHAAWMKKSYYQQIPLLPLGTEAIEELLRDLLGGDPSLGSLGERIRERTGGNPFFIEEVVEALAETGSLQGAKGAYGLARPAAELRLPATVQAVLAARIDRLPEREKQVLETAAVIGREFTEPVLRRVAELSEIDLAAALQKLTSAEFVYEEALYPQVQYTFKHALTQEVAYGSQLLERRARIHEAVARALAEIAPEARSEQAAVLADHWERAGKPLEAARSHLRAGRWLMLQNLGEALRHWRRVRELLAPMPDGESADLRLAACRLLLAHAHLGVLRQDEAEVLFGSGKALAEERGDLRSLALLTWGYSAGRRTRGHVREHLERMNEVARLVKEIADDEIGYALQFDLVQSHRLVGDLRGAEALARALIDRPRPTERYGERYLVGVSPVARTTMSLARVLIDRGRFEEAEPYIQRVLSLSLDARYLLGIVIARSQLVELALWRGEERGVLETARLALQEVDSVALAPRYPITATVAAARAHLVRREFPEAVTAFERAIQLAREQDADLDVETAYLADLAGARLGGGDASGALQTAEETLTLARSRGTLLAELDAEIVRARALLAIEGRASVERAEASLAVAKALIEKTGAESRLPLIHVARAELARAIDDREARATELREAHRLFTEIGAPIRAAEVAKELKG